MNWNRTWPLSAGVVALLGAASRAQLTTRVSVDSSGAQANSSSVRTGLSADGRFVAFCSEADNLVPGDTNAAWDAFVRDRYDGTTERVSVSSTGAQSQGVDIYDVAISADGRYVVFTSFANDLVSGDGNGADDAFVHDRVTHTTTLVSVDSASSGSGSGISIAHSISADGRFVAFRSDAADIIAGDTNGCTDIFVRDLVSGTSERVSVDSNGVQGNGESQTASLSADGRYVAFVSAASNLVVGDTNGLWDVFVRDRVSGTTERASVDSAGAQSNDLCNAPVLSADGRHVAFHTAASNLVPGDTNGCADVFVHDRFTATTVRVSLDLNGVQGDHDSVAPAFSADGRFVAFSSAATNLLSNQPTFGSHSFVRELMSGANELVSADSNGVQGNLGSYGRPSISADARFLAFESYATNLVAGDTNGGSDIFVRDRAGCTPVEYCTAKVNSAGCTPSIVWAGAPSVTPGKRFLIGATRVLVQHTGILFYGVHGPSNTAFQGGTMCVSPPTQRTHLQMSQSSGAPPCAGVFSFDFNGRIASGIDPALALGRQVWAQYWMRDGAAPSGTGLSDALEFAICQ
jgi:Tol biopolymer transport system component